MKQNFTLLFILFFSFVRPTFMKAQCDVTNITGDYIVSSSIVLSGTYNITGKFIIPSGVTVFVNKYSSNSCGKLEIYAASAIIQGSINANDAGYTGGAGGLSGSNVTSLTGDIVSLTGCSNKDNTGQVTIEGGKLGFNGNGPGAGLAGTNGQNGSGPKQQCLSNSDESGMIGSGGGAGGGAGGSYGGSGTNSGIGGNGTNTYISTGVNVSTGFAVMAGVGGNGGMAEPVYGTANASDIELGSGGAGGGGGARSYIQGGNGGKGGNGGGMIKIIVQDTLIFSGSIFSNGANGLNGGIGGDGGVTAKCCADGCDDCGEANLSCGAGGGGGAGGGSGGGVYLESLNYMNVTGMINTKGGNGGFGGTKGYGVTCNYSAAFCGTQALTSGDGNDGNLGGAAGGGRIKIFANSCVTNTINPITSVAGGTGFTAGNAGSYILICNSSTTSIEENTAYHKLSIYPNPSTDIINIKFKFPQFLSDDKAKLGLYDVSSRLVKVEKCELNNIEEQQINIGELRSGVYFLKLVSNEITVIEKIIKQ